eukprot:6948686-Karenia_brevis.AAC.1
MQRLWRNIQGSASGIVSNSATARALTSSCPPPKDILQAALEDIRQQCDESAAALRRQRANTWKQWVTDAWERCPGQLHKWCKGERQSMVSLVQRPDGTYTGAVDEIDRILREAWSPILEMYLDKAEPGWD